MKRATILRLATTCLILYWLTLCLATHLPKSVMPGFTIWDKFLHWGAFSGLAFLIATVNPIRNQPKRHFFFVFTVTSLYGIADELTQWFVPGRVCDFWDGVANSCGALTGVASFYAARKFVQLYRQRSQIHRPANPTTTKTSKQTSTSPNPN